MLYCIIHILLVDTLVPPASASFSVPTSNTSILLDFEVAIVCHLQSGNHFLILKLLSNLSFKVCAILAFVVASPPPPPPPPLIQPFTLRDENGVHTVLTIVWQTV